MMNNNKNIDANDSNSFERNKIDLEKLCYDKFIEINFLATLKSNRLRKNSIIKIFENSKRYDNIGIDKENLSKLKINHYIQSENIIEKSILDCKKI